MFFLARFLFAITSIVYKAWNLRGNKDYRAIVWKTLIRLMLKIYKDHKELKTE